MARAALRRDPQGARRARSLGARAGRLWHRALLGRGDRGHLPGHARHGPGSSWRGERAWSSTHRSRRRDGGARRRASPPTPMRSSPSCTACSPRMSRPPDWPSGPPRGATPPTPPPRSRGRWPTSSSRGPARSSVGTLPPIDDVLPAVLDRLDAPLLRRTTSASCVAVDPGLRPALASWRPGEPLRGRPRTPLIGEVGGSRPADRPGGGLRARSGVARATGPSPRRTW